MIRRLSLLALIALPSGCAVGPDYHGPPKVAMQPQWVEPAGGAAVDDRWWERFGDPELVRLIAEGEASSPTLKAARDRIAQARANRDVAAGGRLPQVEATGSAARNRVSENGEFPIQRIPGFSRDFSLYEVGFDASWDIDLWGHTARGIEAANARIAASEADRRAALLDLRAEIARTYIELRAAQARFASAKADSDARAQTAALVAERRAAGEASQFDEDRATAQAKASAAALPAIEADIRASAYRLAMLVGRPPEALLAELADPHAIPAPPARIAMGLRSNLLRRRPDIIAAERQLAAANAEIGVAVSDLFPRLSLLGAIGEQSRSTGNLFDAGSLQFQAGPSLHWSIFDAGRIRAQIRGARAGAAVAADQYIAAVLSALADSETAANRYARARQTAAEAQAAEQAQAGALVLARQRYRAGESDLLELLDAQSAESSALQAADDARAQAAEAAVALYKALGGGA